MSPQDRLDVIDLIAAYAQALDAAEFDAFIANFAPNAVVELNGRRYEGKEAIAAWFNTMLAAGRIGAAAHSRHFIGLPVVHGDSARCSARTYITLYQLDAAGKPTVPFVGSYTDICVKVDGRWLFEQRHIDHDLGGFH